MDNLVKSIEASLPKEVESKTSPAPSTTSGSASRDVSPSSSPEPCTLSLCSLLSTPVQPQPTLVAEAPHQDTSAERAQLLAEVAAEVRRTVELEAEQKFREAWRRCECIYEGIAQEQAKQQEALERQLRAVLGAQSEAEQENRMLQRTIQLLASRLDQALQSGVLKQRAAPGLREPREPGLPCHTVLLSRSEGQSVGLDLSPGVDQRSLEVARVLPGGAAEIWNRQAASQSQRIVSGDRLVSVNGVATADAMVQELRQKRMLKIKIQRGDRQCDRVQRGIA